MADARTNDSLEQVFLMSQSKDLQSSLKLARELTGLNQTQSVNRSGVHFPKTWETMVARSDVTNRVQWS